MDSVARRSRQNRADIFAEAAANLRIRPAIAEKDFWVCYVLNLLFTKSPFQTSLVFKGGTSLSKVYGLIERFSEDIDLVLDWKLIGVGEGLGNPMQLFGSRTKQDRFNKEVNRLAAEFIRDTLCPGLQQVVRYDGVGLSAALDDKNPHVVNIAYPAAFPEAYIRPEVRLEIGPLASWAPSSRQTIRPYAYHAVPKLFANPDVPVVAIAAERTFWEKATILHAEAHRRSVMPQRYSRHYYDLYRLSQSRFRDLALARPELLSDVVAFKERFYPSTWARYDLARPGTFRLIPGEQAQRVELAEDYEAMRPMLFGDPPAFQTILQDLAELEAAINSSSSAPRIGLE